ncbi:uncharacterized protein LOC109827483 [Asparagus officinalis]|uniref:uncharacterized protein LOC109827483 n=1 Tax=Asparagus officinalis TaxID=4686 RepID=UPI00098E5C96|nr:uncharacterized protein LOC109827483 [Asparagus officinalis]
MWEILLDLLNVDSVQNQRLAAFSLKGDAGGWYRLQFTPDHRMALTWEDFVYFFDEQYISSAAQAGKELELSKLEQGDMSVTDYESQFMSLLCFTGMWQSGERQAQMFLMILRPSLHRYLVSRRFRSVQEVADTAISQEIETVMFQKNKEGNNKSGQQNDKGKGKRPFAGLGGPQQRGKDFHHHQQGKFKKGVQHDSRAPLQRKIQGACYNCNKIGHKAKDCRSAPVGGQQGRGQDQQQNRGHGQ